MKARGIRSTVTTARLTVTTPTGAKINPADGRTTKAIAATMATPALTPPRAKLVRIPDGTAAGGIAGTVNTAVLQPNYATLLRRRVTTEDDPYAQLGLRGSLDGRKPRAGA